MTFIYNGSKDSGQQLQWFHKGFGIWIENKKYPKNNLGYRENKNKIQVILQLTLSANIQINNSFQDNLWINILWFHVSSIKARSFCYYF
jgi:hypothetical protein